MKTPTLLWSVSLIAACAAGAAPDQADQQRLADARRLMAADPDRALLITDDLKKTHPDWADVWFVSGQGSLQLARTRDKLREQLLRDAVRDLGRVIDADATNVDALLDLANAHYELGEFAAARDAAGQAGRELSTAKAAPERISAAAWIAARAEVQQFVAARRQEIQDGTPDNTGLVRPGKDVLAVADSALNLLRQGSIAQPVEASRQSATVMQWLGRHHEALLELERGIRRNPDAADLHLALQDAYVQNGQFRGLGGAYSQLVRELPGTPILRWFQGRAQVLVADELRRQGSFQPAIDTYRKAHECYAEYRAMVPAHAAAASQWLAICNLSIARTCVDMGDLTSAQEQLWAAADASPAATEYDGMTPVLVDSFGSHFAGVVFAISRALSQGGVEALPQTMAFNEAVIGRCPGKFGFVYNNAALPARDLGVRLEQQAQADGVTPAQRQQLLTEAMALWEKSYRWYEEAAKLSPDDPRIVNDCGLMLIYHLNRDFDHARKLFEQAIAVGQPQIDALAADTPESERTFLEEAVGDAWQNIAVLMARHQQRPFAEYRQFCEQAVKYYPYQQRAAAHMLKNAGKEPEDNARMPATLRSALAQSGTAMQGGAAEEFAKIKPAAVAKAAAGDFDGALVVLDAALKALKDHAPFKALQGEYTLRFAEQKAAAGKREADFLFADAVTALKRAVELDSDPNAPRLLLAQAQLAKGDTADAVDTASRLLLHMQSGGGGKADEITATHRIRAAAGARAYAEQKQAGKDQPELLADVRTSMRHLEQQGTLDAALLQTWSATEQWAGAGAEAVGIWARALTKAKDDQALLSGLVDTAANVGQSTLAVTALKNHTDATAIWFRGRAHFNAAGEIRLAGSAKEALGELTAARDDFGKSMAANAGFRDSCEQWQALCLGRMGNIAFQMDDLAKAEEYLVAAVQLRGDQVATDLGMSESIKLGLLRVADAWFKKGDLGHAERIFRAGADAANSDIDLLNNAGLFARDYGDQLAEAGKHKDAAPLYEQSYKAYARAQELDPTNVRLRNDTALILIWHLERDWDKARTLLDAAIVEGEKTLNDNPPAEPQARQDLAEAVGDCYENLALWHLKHSKDGAAAKAAAQKSQTFHPGERRPGARRHLAAAERLLKGN
ncbi:MAG: hypothetical protein IPK26_27505 [Planctomycetes bacterium]|nr:hypothetical protein [Planctomycetota bacterium]